MFWDWSMENEYMKGNEKGENINQMSFYFM